MSLAADEREQVRVQADSAELEAPRGQAVEAVASEGEQVEQTWTATDFADNDWEHPDTRPRMRGWLHLFAFFGAIVAGAVLIPLASVLGARSGFSVAVYCLTICGLFGVSALYHRRRWSPRGWKMMKRLDHSMILKLSWPTAPRWVGVPLYIGLGWVAVFVLTDILHFAGITAMVLLAVGGLLYTIGGITYGIKKPNPWPGTFGYHEVFHAMTIVAAICHNIAVYFAMYNSPFV
jgi:hemolysin III